MNSIGAMAIYSNNGYFFPKKRQGRLLRKAPLPIGRYLIKNDYMFMPPSTWMTWPLT